MSLKVWSLYSITNPKLIEGLVSNTATFEDDIFLHKLLFPVMLSLICRAVITLTMIFMQLIVINALLPRLICDLSLEFWPQRSGNNLNQ